MKDNPAVTEAATASPSLVTVNRVDVVAGASMPIGGVDTPGGVRVPGGIAFAAHRVDFGDLSIGDHWLQVTWPDIKSNSLVYLTASQSPFTSGICRDIKIRNVWSKSGEVNAVLTTYWPWNVPMDRSLHRFFLDILVVTPN